MTTEVLQIKNCYETLDMSPEQIAEDRGLELPAVKAALMQSSSKYRVACSGEPDDESKLNFSDEQLEAVNTVILQTALYAEDPHLKFKAATYIRDDKKGRKDAPKQLGGQQFNILMVNEALRKNRSVADDIKRSVIEA